MFQESLFRHRPWRSTTVWPAAWDPQSRTDSRTPSLVVTVRLQASDRRAPGTRRRLHRDGGVCGAIALLPDMAVFGGRGFQPTSPRGVELAVVDRSMSACGQVARFVEVVCGAVHLERGQPHLADDVEK